MDRLKCNVTKQSSFSKVSTKASMVSHGVHNDNQKSNKIEMPIDDSVFESGRYIHCLHYVRHDVVNMYRNKKVVKYSIPRESPRKAKDFQAGVQTLKYLRL